MLHSLLRVYARHHFLGTSEKASNSQYFLCFGLICTSPMDSEKESAKGPIYAYRTGKQRRFRSDGVEPLIRQNVARRARTCAKAMRAE